MTDFRILADLGLVVTASAALLLVARRSAVPPILTYMVTGLLLGPFTGLLRDTESVDLFAELGVALLLFVVGLELSVGKIRAIGRTAVVAGVVQVGLMTAAGAGLGLALGFGRGEAVVVGLVTAFSSTVVVIKLLDRSGELQSLTGRLSIGILLVQDVLVAVVLTLLAGLGSAGGRGGSGLEGLALAFLGMAALTLAGAAVGRWILPDLVRWMSSHPEGLFVVSLTWAFAFVVAAETLHVSVELGAFIAGVILAQLPYNEELRRRTHPLVDFFLAIFFVALGAGIDPEAVARTWPAALAISALVLLGKPLLILLLLGALGQPRRSSVLAGLTLGQISEFGFILAGLAASVGLVDLDFLGLVGAVGLVTIGVSALVVPRGEMLLDLLDRRGWLARLPGLPEEPVSEPPPPAGHVVVVGMNTLGRDLVGRFAALGEEVVAVDTDPAKLEGLDARSVTGDLTHPAVFEKAGAPRAALVVSALQIEEANRLVTFRCTRLGVPVAIHAFDPSGVEELLELGADHLMVSKLDGIGRVEDALVELGVIG